MSKPGFLGDVDEECKKCLINIKQIHDQEEALWMKNVTCRINKQTMLGPNSKQNLKPPRNVHPEGILDLKSRSWP